MNTEKKIKLLCISRRYYPSLGGMSTFCSAVFPRINKDDFDVTMLVLGKSQIHLLWFFPYVICYLIWNARRYDAIFVGDLLMCVDGWICGKISPKTKRIVAVHGLDITYPNIFYQWYIRKFSKGSFDKYVCNSDATRELLNSIGDYDCVTVPSGVDKDRYIGIKRTRTEFLQRYGIDAEKTILLTTGRLIKRKGVNWFLRNVLSGIRSEIVYFIVGKGPELNEIIHSITELNLGDRVRVITEVSDELMDDIYCNADLFIMPNIHIENDMEGFGLVAIEASLAGMVVIAADVDGISTAVQDGRNGYLIEGGNAQAFIDKIEEVLDADNYREAGLRFSKFTRENYDWDIVVKRYETIIKGLLR